MYGPVVDLTFHLTEYNSHTVSLLLVSSYWFYKTTIKQPKLVNDMWLCESLKQNTITMAVLYININIQSNYYITVKNIKKNHVTWLKHFM